MLGIATFNTETEQGKRDLEEFLNTPDLIIIDQYQTRQFIYINYKTNTKSKLYPNQ